MRKASSICLERQSLYLAVILNSILGGEGRSVWESIQCLTMWDFGENPTASLTCSTARSCKERDVSPIEMPSLGVVVSASSFWLEIGLQIVHLDS